MVPLIIDLAVRLLGPLLHVLYIILLSFLAGEFFFLDVLGNLIARPNFINLSFCNFLR